MNTLPLQRLALAGLLAVLPLASALAALKEGERAPAFHAQASLAGKAFSYSLKDALAKGPVVVYFYPSAYTNGCNLQARSFALHHEQFTAAGASIIGVSLDSIARLNDFSADPEYCGGKVAVASDTDGKISRAYDLSVREADTSRKDTRGQAIDHGYADRTTFIVTPDGRIAATIGGLTPVANVERALAAVQKLAAGPR